MTSKSRVFIPGDVVLCTRSAGGIYLDDDEIYVVTEITPEGLVGVEDGLGELDGRYWADRFEWLGDVRPDSVCACPGCNNPVRIDGIHAVCVPCHAAGCHLTMGCVRQDERKAHRHMLEALRELAAQRCNTRNCGTVCLCGSCHARAALVYYDPEWTP